MPARKLVETENLVSNFHTFEGTVKALNALGLIVNEGETYGLVGESGCGKSVTVRSIMRVLQEPGRIESGKIFVHFNDDAGNRGIDLVRRSEAYMQSIRGSAMSMIFQEPGAALNPVMSVSEQIGESFEFHRLPQLLDECLAELAADTRGGPAGRLWRAWQAALFRRERAERRRYEEQVQRLDADLLSLEPLDDPVSMGRKDALNRRRDQEFRPGWLLRAAGGLPLLRRYRRRLRRLVRARVVTLLADLGIPNPDNVARRYPHELSGGMQQRIVIAIALACHPTLLIADEPTSNLDVTIQAQIVELIRELKKKTISSVLFITHDLGLVAEVCDRVTVMYAGDMAETAAVRDLFAEPLHPYTRSLLDSVPKALQEGQLATIPGAVPNLVRPPSGCRFHPRCPAKMPVCETLKPGVAEARPGHFVACHLYPAKDSAHA